MTTQGPEAIENQPRPPDKLMVLINEDLPRERKRIGDQEAAVEQLKNELVRTILPLLSDLGISVAEFRNWAAFSHKEHSDHLDEHEHRLSLLEDSVFSTGTQLSAEDADLFGKCVVAAEAFAEEALTKTSSPDGRSKLQQVLELCKQATKRIDETTVEDDDEDEDEEDGEDETVQPTSIVATPSSPGAANLTG